MVESLYSQPWRQFEAQEPDTSHTFSFSVSYKSPFLLPFLSVTALVPNFLAISLIFSHGPSHTLKSSISTL